MLASRIANLIRQNGWALNLLFIALGAYFVAGAANAVLARSIRVVPTVDDAPVKMGRHTPTHVGQTFTQIADRNLLAIKRESLSPVLASAEPESSLGDTFNEEDLRPCTMSANVRATLVFEDEPEWSTAVLFINNEPEVFSINEGSNSVTDDAKVVEIRERAVVVRRRDHYELCNADENAAAPAPMASFARNTEEAPSEEGGVTKVGETQYNIERGEIDRALNNINEIATQARIVPSFKNGKANGFKLFSIKPGSIFSKIGMQNGDVIQKINGYEMSSPDKALEIYSKLKDSTSITIDLQRRGQPMNFSYNIGR